LHDDRRNGGQEDVFKRSRILDSQQGCTFYKEVSMTAEDEEFNRIEMESRIKQEYIRAMRKTTREEKISRPAVYEVPANNRMIASHQDHVRRLMEELAIARVCIRELGDRLAKLEGKQ
jgi:hypothetical protein